MITPVDVNRIFFLGGHDLEMLTIRELLAREVPGRFHDKGLRWGAKASKYRGEIESGLARGHVPVLVELTDDLGLDPHRVIVVDHHGPQARADRPTSLHQVFDLLGLSREKWTRWFELVAANDRGYVPALREAGATQEEIKQIRSADRAAQGITAQDELQGESAVTHAQRLAGGLLTVVRLPHTRTATVADRLEPALGGPGYQSLLVVCPGEVNFFGSGNLVQALHETFPGGWYGGALPDRGFWGHGEPVPDVLPVLLERIREQAGKSRGSSP